MNEGQRITDRPQLKSIPAGSAYLVESGDGSGTKYVNHEDLVKKMNEDLSIGDIADLKELDKLEDQEEQEEPGAKEKLTFVKALFKVLGIVTAVFKGTDGIKAGTAGMVPPPGPEDEGKVLGAEGKWVPAGNGGNVAAENVKFKDENNAEEKVGDIDGITEDLNCENPKIAASAVGLKKVNDRLGTLTFYEDEKGDKYVVGADSVPKKLGSSTDTIFGELPDGNLIIDGLTFDPQIEYQSGGYFVKDGMCYVSIRYKVLAAGTNNIAYIRNWPISLAGNCSMCVLNLTNYIYGANNLFRDSNKNMSIQTSLVNGEFFMFGMYYTSAVDTEVSGTPLIPKATENTHHMYTDMGSLQNTMYLAFDDDIETTFGSLSSSSHYIQYTFDELTYVDKIRVYCTATTSARYKVSISEDGLVFSDETTYDLNGWSEMVVGKSIKAIRVTGNSGSNAYYPAVRVIQAYRNT